MKKNTLISVAIIMLCIPFIQTSKEEPNAYQQHYQKILVLSLGDSQNKVLTGNMESLLTDQLNAMGYPAVSAINQYGYNAFQYIREEETLKQLYPYDAVMTITLLDGMKEKCCRPAPDSSNFLWEYYSTMYNRVNTPGYYTDKGKYYWDINLYELNSWQLKYAMHTQNFNPAARQYQVSASGKYILDEMTRNNVLQKKESPLKAF